MARAIYDPKEHECPMDIVAFGSGSCSTIEKIIERQHLLQSMSGERSFRVAALVTDNIDSKAHKIARREGIPLVHNNLERFMKENGLDPENAKDRKDPEMRMAFDERTKEMLLRSGEKHGFGIDVIALAGYMLKLNAPILDCFAGKIINSHPADLSIFREDGKRRYTGANAVRDAIIAGEKETYTTIHLVRKEVDAGEILVRSRPLPVDRIAFDMLKNLVMDRFDVNSANMILKNEYERKRVPEEKRVYNSSALFDVYAERLILKPHQELQKERCDYPAYLFALDEIARGNFALEHEGNALKTVVYKGENLPYSGFRL